MAKSKDTMYKLMQGIYYLLMGCPIVIIPAEYLSITVSIILDKRPLPPFSLAV